MKPHTSLKTLVLLISLCQFGIAQIKLTDFDNQTGYTLNDGLASDYIADITEDANGFMWVATSDGISKYDGNHFANFRYYYQDTVRYEIGDVHTLSMNPSRTKLWIGADNGVFHTSVEEVSLVKVEIPSFPLDRRIDKTLLVENKFLWATIQKRGMVKIDLETLDQETFIFKYKNHEEDSDLNSIITITQDPLDSNILWLGTLSGLIQFDIRTKEYEVFLHNNTPGAAQNRIRKVYASEKDVYLGTWTEGLIVFNKNKKEFDQPLKPKYPNAHQLVFDMYEESKESLWITTSHGLIHYNPLSKSINKIIQHNPSQGKIRGVSYIDSRGIIWFCDPKGLFKYDPIQEQNTFIALEERELLETSMKVRKIIESQGYFYAIGYATSGIYKINPDDYLFEIIKIPYFKYIEGAGYSVADMIKMNDGRFLILSGKKLVFFDPKTEKFEISPLQIPREGADLRTVVKDNSENYWIGTRHAGLFCLNFKSKTITNYEEEFNELHDGNHAWIENLYVDSLNQLWIRTAKYFSVMDLETRAIQNLVPQEHRSIYHNVGSFLEDSKGRIWIIGHKKGIGYIDAKGDKKKIFHQINGRYNKLYPYSDSLIWTIGKNFGTININTLEQNEIMLFPEHEKQKIRGPVIQSEKGEFLIGCNNGIAVYDPRKQKLSKNIPLPYIRKVVRDGKKVYEGSNFARDEFSFKSGTKHIAIQISSLSFRLSDKFKYQYKLQDTWIDIGTNNEINFTNLSPNEYVLNIKAVNKSLPGEEVIVSYDLIILPPWYGTWWAFLLYGLAIISFIIVVVRWRSARLQMEKEILETAVKTRTTEIFHKNEQLEIQAQKLKEMDQIKSDFFANISHEFRTPLTLIKGPIDHSLQHKEGELSIDNLKMIHRNTNHLLRLVNQLLDLSKLDSGNLRLERKQGDIYHCLRAISSSFDSYAVRKKVVYTTAIPKEEMITVFDHDKIEKILYNLLSNAFKFTAANGKVHLESFVEDNNLKIKVNDTGKGIAKEQLSNIFNRFYQADTSSTRDQQGTGIGLALTKELVTLMNGDIQVESDPETGTTFSVKIPLEEVYVKKETVEIDQEFVSDSERIESEKLSDFVASNKKEQPIVLIVEDHRDMRKYIHSYLKESYHVIEAEDGQSGLEIALKEIPDLIITDLMMPKLDGIDLCKNLKSDQNTSHIPIIMLTAKDHKESKIQGFIEGVDEYLTKPFDSTELIVRVSGLIKQREALRKIFSKQITLEPKAVAITSLDEKFLSKVQEYIETNIANSEYGIRELQEELFMSRTQFHRKMKALTDLAPGEFLRNYRLKRAAQILRTQPGENVTQIAFAVGFKSLSYFTKCFKEYYGIAPSKFSQDDKVEIE